MDAYDPVGQDLDDEGAHAGRARRLHGRPRQRPIIIVGGEGNARDINVNGVFPDTDGYDPVTDTWRVYAPMRTPRHGTGAAGVGGKLYVPGGATAQGGGDGGRDPEAFTPP